MTESDARRVSCVHAERCPGCALIGLSYGEQLAQKRAIVERALRRHADLTGVAVDDALAADPIAGYRVRAKLAASGARLGAFLPEGHEVLDIPECRVHTPAIAAALGGLRAYLRERPIAALSGVDLRSAIGDGDERVLLTLIVLGSRTGTEERRTIGEAILAACPQIAGVSWSASSAGPQLLGRDSEHVAGERELEDRLGPVRLIAAPGAFVQAHRGQAERVVGEIVRAFGSELEEKRIIDLYGGSGAIGLSLAARGAKVTVVETHRRAVAAAERAAEGLGKRVQAVAEDAARFLARSAGARWDAIVVNPPRRGLAPDVRAGIAAHAVPVAYVSCNPETLARDLAHFSVLGLAAERVLPVDMIPLTEEVESVVVLRPGKPARPRVIYEDRELIVVDKPPHEPTTPQGEHRSSLLARVRKLPGCSNAAPLHRLDVGTSGVCIFAKSPAAAGRWARSLPDADKRYVALCRGVWSARGVVNRALPGERSGRKLTTRYRRLEVAHGQSLLEVTPESGKKHQIRRHLAGIGHAIVGDARYGHAPTNRHFAERYGLDRAFLHCARIEIAIPDLHAHVFEAELAGDLAAVLAHGR